MEREVTHDSPAAQASSLWTLVAAVLLAAICASRADAQIMTYRITRTTDPPAIDGVLDDACWKTACAVTDFALLGRGEAKEGELPPTRAMLTYDADSVYVAFHCVEPLSDRLVTAATEHDDPTWMDDGVELFFNPSGDRQRYVQIAVNAAGVLMDGYIPRPGVRLDTTYETGAAARTRVGKGEWAMEIKVPFAGLPLTGPSGVWTFHLARNRRAAQQLITALHSPVSGYHEITKFDRLEGISLPERPVGLMRVSLGEMFQGVNICRVTLKNWGKHAASVTVHAGIVGEKAPQRRRQPATIGPGAEMTVEVPWELRPDAGGKRAGLEVRSGDRLLQARSFVVGEVPPIFGALRRRAFYFSQHEFVRMELPVQLAEGSRRNVRLRWEAVAGDGARVGRGLTLVRDPLAVIRLYWQRWQDGRYAIRFTLVRDDTPLASTEQQVRLVANPWGE